MKKLSKQTKIIGISILSTLVLFLCVGIALSMQKYEDPIVQVQEDAPLGNYDYSKRPFFAKEDPIIYKGDIYLRDTHLRLSRIPLSELSCDVRTEIEWKFPDNYPICTDSSHDHDGNEDPEGCLDNKIDAFVIDAYESNGGSPIVYHTHYGGFLEDDEEIDAFGDIVRYDTASMKADTIVSIVGQWIYDVMTYDNQVFFITCTAEGVYSANVVSKKGGDITTLELGKHGWTLMWATDDHMYYQDNAGNIYRATLDLKNPEFVFYAETISAMAPDRIGTFIHGNYLYYEADYEIVPYLITTETINFAKHSIYRVPLNNLYGESELVVENVLDNCVFGVGNNVLYYQPCVMGERVSKEYYFNWTGGQLLGVNLDTLEPVEMINDIGLDLTAPDLCYTVGNALIVTAMPIDDRYHCNRYAGWGMRRLLYDTTTGALYPLCTLSFFA